MMTSAKTLQRVGIALALVTAAVASLVGAHSALAGRVPGHSQTPGSGRASGRMIFLAPHVEQNFQLNAWFSAKSGVLTLDPSGAQEAVHVEILAPAGRAPASVDQAAQILKRLTISRPTSINLAELSKGLLPGGSGSPELGRLARSEVPHLSTIRIRVLAP